MPRSAPPGAPRAPTGTPTPTPPRPPPWTPSSTGSPPTPTGWSPPGRRRSAPATGPHRRAGHDRQAYVRHMIDTASDHVRVRAGRRDTTAVRVVNGNIVASGTIPPEGEQ